MIQNPTAVPRWQTSDGKTHNTEEAANEWQRRLNIEEALKAMGKTEAGRKHAVAIMLDNEHGPMNDTAEAIIQIALAMADNQNAEPPAAAAE